jgi:hypothetical protein
VTNEPWTYVDKMPPWRAGQPTGNGDCLELGSKNVDNDPGTINDQECPMLLPYLCEWSPPGMP